MIVETIQIALAPVFVLVAIGNIIGTLAARLGRVVDRSRDLQGRYADTQAHEHDLIVAELRVVDQRIALISRALLCLVLAAIGIGLTVSMIFLDGFVPADLQPGAAIAFFVALAMLMVSLLLFLRETRLATASLRIPQNFLEIDRKL